MKFTVPKGIRQKGSGTQRMGIFFIMLSLVQWRVQRRGGGMVPCLFPGAPAGEPFFASKGPFQMGPFWYQRGPFGAKTVFAPGANLTKKSPFYTEKREICIFCGTFSASAVPLELQGAPLPLPGTSSGSANAVISGQLDIHEDLKMRIFRVGRTGTEQGELGRVVSVLPKSIFLLRMLPTQNVL